MGLFSKKQVGFLSYSDIEYGSYYKYESSGCVLCNAGGEIYLHKYTNKYSSNISVPYDVTVIGEGAFCDCDMTDVSLPSGLKAICSEAFYNCNNLKSLRIPSSVEYISINAFKRCDGLRVIYVPRKLEKTIGGITDCLWAIPDCEIKVY